MGGQKNWNLTAKVCTSCQTAPATVFCRADSAFLCAACDVKLHAATKMASRHARVWLCEVCEQAPATVTCKADAAALCPSCDRDIHSANPLSRRHERLPLAPFYDAASAAAAKSSSSSEEDDQEDDETASWLLPNLNAAHGGVDLEEDTAPLPEYKSAEYLLRDLTDPYLDLDLVPGEQKIQVGAQKQHHHHLNSPDGVVPEQTNGLSPFQGPIVDGIPAYHNQMDYQLPKPFMYNFTSQSISHSVSSSSLDVGVVPDHIIMNSGGGGGGGMGDQEKNGGVSPSPLSGLEREARVLRYREKRKNRKFEKTIRYASRKAYAESRPRIKGRFAKRSESEQLLDASYGVVPSF